MILDPNMNFDLPVPQVTLGPTWSTQLNTAMGIVGSHDHSTGSGVKVTPSGLNINADLPFGDNNATLLRTTRYSAQSAALAEVADVNAVYSVNGNLYWNNATGSQIQITDGAGLNFASLGTIGGDFGQPGVLAAVTYSDSTKTFAFTRSAGSAAIIIGSTLKVVDATPGSQSIGITASATAISYDITLADAVPVTNQSIVTINTDGTLSYQTTLSANLTLTGNWTYSGTPTVAGNITRTGTATGGTYSGTTLAGTTTNSGTISGGTISGATFTTATLTSPTISNALLNGTTTTQLTASQFVVTGASSELSTVSYTGTGTVVLDTSATLTSPTLVTPVLGTPSSGTLTNATGLPISTGVSGLAAGVATFLATPSSANLATVVTDETGSGALVFGTSPTIASPTVTGTVAGSATYTSPTLNSPVLVTPALGIPASGTLTNATGLPISTGVSGLASGMATFLATPTSANLAATVTNETGSGSLVFGTSPTIASPQITGTVTGSAIYNAIQLSGGVGITGSVTGGATYYSVTLQTPTFSGNPAGTVVSGTYTPTITNVIGGGALVSWFAYTRVGAVVHVVGRLYNLGISSGNFAFTISLPITSSGTDRAGVMSATIIPNGVFGGAIESSGSTTTCLASGAFNTGTLTTNLVLDVSFMYLV